MKIINIIFALLLTLSSNYAFANEQELIKEQTIQSKINDCGYKILNSNQIQNRIIFVYNNSEKKSVLKNDKTLANREIVVFGNTYKNIENQDELAAFLAREIVIAARSYDGIANGFLRSLQIKAAPKKFEIVADKRAVDFMVVSGYNPIGLITFIQKTNSQQRQDTFSTHNLTSKRLAIIYEYIYKKYPYYLKENPYFYTESYQNFLLTSQNNRKMLAEKIKNNSKENLKYE